MSKPTSTLRQTYINELTLRGLSPRTIECYVGWVYDLARYQAAGSTERRPTQAYLLHLRTERKLRSSSIHQAVYSLRSFYSLVLTAEAELKKVLIAPRIEVRRPEVFSVQEVERLLTKGTRSCGSERFWPRSTRRGCGSTRLVTCA